MHKDKQTNTHYNSLPYNQQQNCAMMQNTEDNRMYTIIN